MSREDAWLFVSPHLDDVVLSCGGVLSVLAERGCPTHVVTVFAGSPEPGKMTPLGTAFAARWGLGAEPVQKRREEDRRALAGLSAEPLHLRHHDCIYRLRPGGPRFSDARSIFAVDQPTELDVLTAVADDLAALIEELHPSVVVGPLGIGRHADHRLTREALTIARGGAGEDKRQLFWFEDLPYAGNGSHPTWQQELAAGLHPDSIDLDEHAFAAKLAALRFYRSQLSEFWPGDAAMDEELRRHALSVGWEGGLAERLWS